MEDLDSKNIYLKKDEEILGLHAVGYKEPHKMKVINLDGSEEIIDLDFIELEKWGNEYNKNLEMIGRGSFHIFDLSIEHAAKELEKDGWVRFNP